MENKNERPTFLGNKLPLTLKRQDLCIFCFLEYCAKYCLDPEPEPGTEPKLNHYDRQHRNGKLMQSNGMRPCDYVGLVLSGGEGDEVADVIGPQHTCLILASPAVSLVLERTCSAHVGFFLVICTLR
jgi:hypothetical protein